jgi:hypothetical protein
MLHKKTYIENIRKRYINYDIHIDILIDMVKDIPEEIEFGMKWNGKYLRPSKHAIYEMKKLDYDLYDVLSILENGYDCLKGRRAKGTYEKCVKKGRKIIKVVVKRVQAYDIDDEVWLIIHVGGV